MSKSIFLAPQLKQNHYICYLASPDIYCYFCKLILNNKICENVVFVTKVWSWLILYIRIRPQRSFNDFWHSPTRPNTFQVGWKCTWSFITTPIPQHKILDYLHCTNEDDFQYACATRAGGQSKCGHCFHLLFVVVPGSLCAPHVVVDGSTAGHCFHLRFPFFFSSTPSAFHPLQENSHGKSLFPPIFWHN